MKNIKQAQRLIRLKNELDNTLNQLSKETNKQKAELEKAFEELNQAFYLKDFKKKINQILIGILTDKGLKPNHDYRINNHRLFLHNDDTLWYKGYGQKLERELDVFSNSIYLILGQDSLENEFVTLLEQGKTLKEKLKTEFQETAQDKELNRIKINETYQVPAWRSGATEPMHVQDIYVKLNISRHNGVVSFEIKNKHKMNDSNYVNDENYQRNEYLFLFPTYRNATKKLIQQSTNKIKQITQRIQTEENKLTQRISTKYATYLLLRGIKK
jgi:hypothetical protein